MIVSSSRGVGRVSPTLQSQKSPKGKKNLLSLKRSEAGLRGFRVTTGRHFCDREDFHKNWLRVHAPAVCAEMASRNPTKFPPRIIHPIKLSGAERFQFQAIALCDDFQAIKKRLFRLKPYLRPSAFQCMFACVHGYSYVEILFWGED